jgi:hypothetical protein
MRDTCRDTHLLAGCWPQDFPADFKLNVALKHHHKFIDGMGVILPRLAGRIGPYIAAKTTGPPAGFVESMFTEGVVFLLSEFL